MKTYREVEDLTPVTKESILNDMFGKYPKLLDYLRAKKFCDWPASKAHHGAEWGGLFKHSLQVTYELQKLTSNLNLQWERQDSPVIVGMLHDVCKLYDYTVLPFGETPDEPDIITNKVPVSSSGTRPVFVTFIEITKTTIPIITASEVHSLWLITRVTPFLYFSVVLSKTRLKLLWKRLTKFLFVSSFSSSCGFKKIAHSAGESVNALIAEMTIDSAIVTPNSL